MNEASRELGRRAFLRGSLCASAVGAGSTGALGGRPTATGAVGTEPTAIGTPRAQVADETPVTLAGDVTTAPVRTGDGRVLVGTSQGVYVVADGTIEQFASTQPVRSLHHFGGDRAIALVEDENFANVEAIDITSGTVAWSHSETREVFSPDFGTIDRQVPAFDAVSLPDGGVAVAAGATVVALDGENGSVQWTHEHDHSVWRLAVAGGTVLGSTGDGTVLGLAPGSGSVRYETRVAAAFSPSDGDPIARSVWDLQVVSVGGGQRVAAAGEDGTVALLAPGDGSLAWETQVVSFDQGTLEEYFGKSGTDVTVPGDAHYFNLELTAVPSESGPGTLAVAVSVDENPSGRSYELTRQRLVGLSTDAGSVRWERENAPLQQAGNVAYSQQLGSLLVAGPPNRGRQTVQQFGVGDGNPGEEIETAAVMSASGGGDRGRGYVTTASDRLVVASAAGDLKLVDQSGTLQWSVPSLRSVETRTGDFLGNGNEDVLVVPQNRVPDESQTRHRGLICRSGADGTVAWSLLLGPEAFTRNGGLTQIQTVTTDAGVDLVALQRQPRAQVDSDSSALSGLVSINGRDGSFQGQYKLVNDDQHALDREGEPFRVTSIAILGDVNDTGSQDILVGTRNRMFVTDLATGDLIWERLYRDRGGRRPGSDAPPQYKPIEDNEIHFRGVGGDGPLEAVAAVGRQTGTVALLEPDLSGGDLSFSTVASGNVGELLRPEFRTVPDRTGDGYDELLVPIRDDGENRLRLYSPGDGSVIQRFGTPREAVVTATPSLTGDGNAGTIAFEFEGEESTLTVYEGREEVWSLTMGRARGVTYSLRTIPAAPVGDIDGDGNVELGVVTLSPRGGTRVRIFNVARDEVVEELTLGEYEEVNRPDNPGFYAQQVPDQTGDGQPELAVVGRQSEGGNTFWIVDPAAGERLLRGPGVVPEFFTFGSQLGLVRGGAMQTIDPANGVLLSTVTDGTTLELEWTFDAGGEYVTTVAVDDRLVARTTGREASVELPGGEFAVRIESITPDGIAIFDSKTVAIDGGSSVGLALYGMAGVSLAVVLALGAIPKLRGRGSA